MTISASPSYPIPGEEVTLSATTTAATDTFQWFLSAVPESSALTTGELDEDVFTPDVQGLYEIEVVEYIGDRIVRSQTGDVYVCELVEFSFKTLLGHGGKLQFRLQEATIRDADFVEPLTETSRQTFLAATPDLTTLIGETNSSIAPTLHARANELRVAYESHRTIIAGGVHDVADTTNIISAPPAYSNDSAIELLNDIRRNMIGHFNSPITPVWHTVDDTSSIIYAGSAATVAEAWLLMAALWIAYTDHIDLISPTLDVHGIIDATVASQIADPGLFEQLLVDFMNQVDSTNRSIGYNYGSEMVAKFGATQGPTDA